VEKLLYGLHDMMQKIGVDYAVCGGHAIDLFLGRKTRPHKDLDVAVFWEDRDQIVRHMLQLGWLVFEPYGGRYLHQIRNVTVQRKNRNNIWCVAPENKHYKFSRRGKDLFAVRQDDMEQVELNFIEFLFSKQEGGCILYARNPIIRMEMDRAMQAQEGIPCLAPAFVLLYKSTALDNPNYRFDFQNAIPHLKIEELKWLNEALNTEYRGAHEWSTEIHRLLERV